MSKKPSDALTLDYSKLHAYPTKLPASQPVLFLHVAALLRGTKTLDHKNDGHLLWHLLGYVAGKAESNLGFNFDSTDIPSYLEKLAEPEESPAGKGKTKLTYKEPNWAVLGSACKKLLAKMGGR